MKEETDGEVAPTEEAEELVPEEEPQVESQPANDVFTLEEVAKQAARGEWGNPQQRRLRLQQAGYDPNEVQREIVRQANS